MLVRLFNAVQAELGIMLLGRGVRITGKSLADLFRAREKAFGGSIVTVRLDGEVILPNDMFEIEWQDQRSFLHVGS